VTSGDYKLLEQMNHVTTEKYKAMTDQATDLVLFMEELQKKCKSCRYLRDSSCACSHHGSRGEERRAD
jgi:hypothetical protein